jgi:hypothetical protein
MSPFVAWIAMPFVCAALIISMAIPYFDRNGPGNPRNVI